MYLAHFRLKAKPFQISADPGFLWMGEKHKEALAVMRYSILDNKGFMLLTGDVGTGKTTLINALVGSLGSETIVATIPDPKLSISDFHRYVSHIYHLGDGIDGKADFLQRFTRFLHITHDAGQKVLLVVDEAQRMSPQLLDEVRVLSNIERPDSKLINIFMVGQNEFNEMLEVRQNRALRQRIALNYHIHPLTEPETAAYIQHRLKIAGAVGEIFSPTAIREVFLFSKGYPRLINILCDHALLSGYVRESHLIGAEIVRECTGELRIPIISPEAEEHPRAAQPEAPHTPPPKESPPHALPISTTAQNRPSPKRRGWILGLAAAIMIALALGVVSFRQPQRLAGWKASLAATGKVLLGESEGDLPPPKNKEPAAITTPATPDPPPSREPVKPAVVPQNPVFHAPPANQAGGPAVRSGNPPTTAETGGASALAIMPPSPAASFPGKGAIIGFEQNSNELFTEHLAILDRLAGHLKDHPTYRVKLTGHTDVAGSAAYNLSVSRFRANIVQAYLVGKGISADRMVIEAFGPLKPAASNETRTGREMNRRVEIEVIEE